jgi:hypothetical protein
MKAVTTLVLALLAGSGPPLAAQMPEAENK